MKYCKKYNLSWPKSEIVKSCLEAKYHRGVDRHGIQWPVDEAPVPITPWSEALSNITQSPISSMKFPKYIMVVYLFIETIVNYVH